MSAFVRQSNVRFFAARKNLSYSNGMGYFSELVGQERLARGLERAMTRKEVLRKAMRGEITWIQASEILRLTARQVRRLKKRFESGGEIALLDGRIGKVSPRRISDEWRKKICELYRTKYSDCSALHFYEKLTKVHRIEVGTYETILRFLHDELLVTERI